MRRVCVVYICTNKDNVVTYGNDPCILFSGKLDMCTIRSFAESISIKYNYKNVVILNVILLED